MLNIHGSGSQRRSMEPLAQRWEDLSQKYPTVAGAVDQVNLHHRYKGPKHPWETGKRPSSHAWASAREAGHKNEIFIDVSKTRSSQYIEGHNVLDARRDHADSALIHEFGHHFHYELNRKMGMPVNYHAGIHEDVQKIIAEEFGHGSFSREAVAASIGSKYAGTNDVEMMAELFTRSELGGQGSEAAQRVMARLHPIVNPEIWRDSLPNKGHWSGAVPIPTIGDIPDLDFSVLERGAASGAEAVIHTPLRQTAKDAIDLGRAAAAHYTPEKVKFATKAASEQLLNLAKEHPRSVGLTAAAVVGALFAHHRKKANDHIGDYSRTIAMGNQSGPSGSAAGLNSAKAAYIQPSGAGYDNPGNQGARYGYKKVAYRTPRKGRMSRPQAYSDYTPMSDSTYDFGNVNQDQQFSRMI